MDKHYLSVLVDDCNPSKLSELLAYAHQKLGDRLQRHVVIVDFTVLDLSEADVDTFRRLSAPVTMVLEYGEGELVASPDEMKQLRLSL